MENGMNVKVDQKAKKLIIEIDLNSDLGPSKSGKTRMIAKMDRYLDEAPGVRLNINCYRKGL